jgi:DsbC/DsbD-like thiol-disulfide interchange protein
MVFAVGAATAGAATRVGPSGAGATYAGHPTVHARLVFDVSQARPGQRMTAGVHFKIKPGWHIYGRVPGQAGLPTRLRWAGDSLRVGRSLWPRPRTFRSAGPIVTHGYEGQVLLGKELRLDPRARGTLQVRVHLRFLACNVRTCVPGRIALRRSLAVGTRTLPAPRAVQQRFTRLRRRPTK